MGSASGYFRIKGRLISPVGDFVFFLLLSCSSGPGIYRSPGLTPDRRLAETGLAVRIGKYQMDGPRDRAATGHPRTRVLVPDPAWAAPASDRSAPASIPHDPPAPRTEPPETQET